MTKLSVNINKIATLRNARGGNLPNVVKAALDCERYGAQEITVHPRPDERHITYKDVRDLKQVVTTEFNIEGNPIPRFIDLVTEVKPTQVTLVPDAEDALTSDAGWDVKANMAFLKDVVARFREANIRVSIFVGTDLDNIAYAAETGCQRVELYTEPYARAYEAGRQEVVVKDFLKAAEKAREVGLDVNAGHDLNLLNLSYFSATIPFLSEVSIGHALICDALYLGLEDTIRRYRHCLLHE